MTSEKGKPGQYFEDFLMEQDIYESATEQAVKRVLAYQLTAEIKNQGISKTEMARRMRTSRPQLERLSDPNNAGITISALWRALQRRLGEICAWSLPRPILQSNSNHGLQNCSRT